MKPIQKLKAIAEIQAYIILDPKGVLIARIHSKTNQGNTRLDLFDYCSNHVLKQLEGIYGMSDRHTDTLAGETIDGHLLYGSAYSDDDCQGLLNDIKSELDSMALYDHKPTVSDLALFTSRASAIDARIANWGTNYLAIYKLEGLELLESKGYKVIQAI